MGAETPAGGDGGLVRSAGAATVSQVWRVGVAFAARVVLRRLVTDAAYGVWQWATDSVLMLLAQIRDLGVTAHVVRTKHRPWGSLLVVELVWGGALSLGVFFGAPVIARAFADPSPLVVPVLRALALFFFLEGLSRVPLTFFEAELAIDRALTPELVRNLVWAVLSVGLAFVGLGIWSMVVAHVAATGLFAAMLWRRARGIMVLHRDPRGTLSLVGESLPLMVNALLLLSATTAGFLVLGAMASAEAVAHYGAAVLLAFLVSRVLELPLRRPLYPAFVAVLDEPERFVTTYRLSTVLLLGLQIPAGLFLLVNAETVLVLLFGETYALAAPYLRLLALVPLVQPFARCAEDVLLARGEERLLIVAAAANLVGLVGVGVLLVFELGPVGIAWAHLVVPGELLLAWGIVRSADGTFRRWARDVATIYLLQAPWFLLASLLPPGPWRLAGSVVAGTVAGGLALWRFGGEIGRFFGLGLPGRSREEKGRQSGDGESRP